MNRLRIRLAGTIEKQDDGGWVATVDELPSVVAYGSTADDAQRRALSLARTMLVDHLHHRRRGLLPHDDR
jgi:predicted RNase H-like HicB family nuclease